MKKITAIMLSAVLCLTLLTGCGKTQTNTDANANGTDAPEQNPAQTLSGDLNLGGSTSVEDAIIAVMDEFKALNPDVTGKYDATGSSTGMTNAIDGTYHLGFASRELKQEEKDAGLTDETFALDGIAVAVNPKNPVKNLTMDQLLKIFTGEVTNWKEIGGNDAQIVVVSREAGSGTRGAFEELVGFEDALTENATIKDGNGNVATYIGSEENAIGYVSFVTLAENTDKITGLQVEGVDATVENVLAGTYKVSRPFKVAYMEGNLDEAEKEFLTFLMSDDGQAIIEEAGAISVNH